MIWTADEVAYLRKNYGKTTAESLAKNLNHSPSAIKDKARREGLTKIIRRLTEAQKLYIKDHHIEMTVKEMDKALGGIGVDAIRRFAKQALKKNLPDALSLCGACSKATPVNCPFVKAELEDAEAVLKKIGAKFTHSRDNRVDMYRIVKCPECVIGDLPPIRGLRGIMD